MEQVVRSHIETKKFCHGYLFYGDREKSLGIMDEISSNLLCEEFKGCGKCFFCGIERHKNPNYYFYNFQKLGIEDSIFLIEESNKKPLRGINKVFHIEIGSLSRESQNALLKTLEEPARGNYFLIYVNSFEEILDTLKSRLAMIFLNPERNENFAADDLSKFLKMNLDEKINFFSKIKDREEAKKFILDLTAESRAEGKNIFDFKKFEEGILLLNANMPMNLIGLRIF